jgi:cytoskeletal protein CcmA (bactofilin family)
MVHNVVFLANDFVTLDRHGVSEGDIHSNNAIQFKKGAPSVYTGNLTAADHITIHTKNTLYGNLMASNEIVVENGAVINGNVSPNTPAATIALPNPSFTAGGSNYTVAANRSLNLLPGYYGTVTLDKNSTLYLSSGNYFFKALDTGVKSVLSLDVSGGAVNINVVDKLDFDKQMKVMTSSGDAGSSLVNFATLQESRLMVGEKARVLGSIIAPEAAIRLSKNSRFKGSICAEEIVVLQGAVFLPHSSSTPLPTIQNITDFEDIDTEETTTSVVTDYELVGNYPNPFNPSTTITFAMPEAGRVTLKIFSETGQLVRTLINGEKPPGQHNVSWNGRNDAGTAVASGMYFYQIVMQKQNGEAAFTETRRMTLVK